MREQREVLERDADAARLGTVLRGVAPADMHFAGFGLFDPRDDAQQHRLAGPRRAKNYDDLAGIDVEREPVDRAARLEVLDEVSEFELGHGDQPFTAPSDKPSTR